MRIHFVGCEGVSMKALMRICAADGIRVTGSDITTTGHREELAAGADEVVYTCAVPKDNPEILWAKRNGVQLTERAAFLGRMSAKYHTVIAVAGSHGKTTVTGMLGKIFEPMDATVHIGGNVEGECGRVGGKNFLITEACEYRRNFLHLNPSVGIVLNVELDHPDYYKNLDDITDAFALFATLSKIRVINGDDPNSAALKQGRYVTFGLGRANEFYADNICVHSGKMMFDAYHCNRPMGTFTVGQAGRHNVYNALAAIAAATVCGVSIRRIRDGLARFSGAKRRFEKLGEVCGADVFSDYAHHPHELRCTVAAAREAGYNKVIVLFEPHTYSRTKTLFNDFAEALSEADEVYLVPIFAAREAPIEGVTSDALARALIARGVKCACFCSFYQAVQQACRCAEKGSAVIFCGAGQIDIAAHEMVCGFYGQSE